VSRIVRFALAVFTFEVSEAHNRQLTPARGAIDSLTRKVFGQSSEELERSTPCERFALSARTLPGNVPLLAYS